MLGGATAAALALSEQSFDPRASVAGTLFAEALPRFVVALGRGDLRNADRARQQATGDAARAALGEEAATHLVDVLTAAESLAAAKSRSEARPSRDSFLASAASLNRALAARGLPYFVDSDATLQNGHIAPVLTTYYVEREALVTSGGSGVRTVHLWRLDDLKLREGYLGYTRPSTPAALVLLDQIESDLVRYVLPALPKGEVMLLVDERTERQAPPWASELSRVAASVVRRHYATLPAEASADVERVAVLLARRRALVRHWRASAGLGAELRVPERLLPGSDYTAELERRVSRAELREWEDIQEQLLEPESVAAFDRVRDRYVASVERHEVQHRIDYRRGLIPVPAMLAERLDVENALDAPQTSLAGRARDELSAYLAAIAQAPDSPLLDLVLLSRFLFEENNLGGPYCYAALAAYEGIAGELGIDPRPYVGDGTAIERARVAELFRRVTACPPADLRAAATRFYTRCFGQPVPEVHRSQQTIRAPWRH